MTDEINALVEHARQIRRKIIETTNTRADGHFGGSLSIVEILTLLYSEYADRSKIQSQDPDRDRVILSKGHCALGMYAALNEFGFITDEELASFHVDGSGFQTHAVKNVAKGIEISSGSLGLGFAMSGGIALALKERASSAKVYVLAGNGEANEGVFWEAVMFIGANKLENMTLVLDDNGMQNDGSSSDVLDIHDWGAKLAAFGWEVAEADGHDFDSLRRALSTMHDGRPLAVVMHTTKGKGIPFMENKAEWHHGKLAEDQLVEARKVLSGGVQ